MQRQGALPSLAHPELGTSCAGVHAAWPSVPVAKFGYDERKGVGACDRGPSG